MARCFVVQGFGKKTDFESGRTLDLDASYEVIKEAVKAAGLECVRADEIKHSRTIDKVMYEQLLDADLVIADLSTSNVNAFYELGVRFALRPRTTIVVGESNLNFPFDINHIPIHTYEHLGSDVGRREANRFVTDLKSLIEKVMASDEPDSPVFTFLPGLTAPAKADLEAKLEAAAPEGKAGPSLSELKQKARKAMSESRFADAISLWQTVREQGPKDDHVVQQLALATYKSKKPSEVEALQKARETLRYLWPEDTLDPETLGLWAAVHKRLFQLKGNAEDLERAIVATEKGFVLRRDYYTGINLAFLLDIRASRGEAAQAEEDRARARGVRRRVGKICETLLESREFEAAERYWVLATLEEVAVGLGDEEAATAWHERAAKAATDPWMLESTGQQIAELRGLLGEGNG